MAASRGYGVSFTYAHDREAAGSLETSGPNIAAFEADVADSERAGDVIDAAEKLLGPVTHLVNNAGTTGPLGTFAASSPDDLRRVMDVNFFGLVAYSRAVLERWAARAVPGVIVNVSSVAAATGAPGEYVGYAASKAAVEALTRGLGREVAADGIRVVAVAPGTTLTAIHEAAGDAERPWRVAPRIPMRRPAEPDEIARAILWAMSDEASYLTATTVSVSGGL
jgi:NAD(P)-dependent dehydrogenase (short-subunit alcohol dehydrogenase family)